MDTKAAVPCLTLTFASSLLVMVWRWPRSVRVNSWSSSHLSLN